MRGLLAVVAQLCVAADPCEELCDRDGPQVCTDGSVTEVLPDSEIEVCRGYYYLGDPHDGLYSYSLDCRLSVYPVTVADVPRLLAQADVPRGAAPLPEESMSLIELAEHLESLQRVTMEQLAILIKKVERELSSVDDFRSPIEWWYWLGGPSIRRLTIRLNRANFHVMRPLIMIATNLNVDEGDELEFSQETGFNDF